MAAGIQDNAAIGWVILIVAIVLVMAAMHCDAGFVRDLKDIQKRCVPLGQ
jgi:hypothetical protein